MTETNKVLSGIALKTNIYPEGLLESTFKIAEEGFIPQAVTITPIKKLDNSIIHKPTNIDQLKSSTDKELEILRENVHKVETKMKEQEILIHHLFGVLEQTERRLEEKINTLQTVT